MDKCLKTMAQHQADQLAKTAQGHLGTVTAVSLGKWALATTLWACDVTTHKATNKSTTKPNLTSLPSKLDLDLYLSFCKHVQLRQHDKLSFKKS